jgi:RNA polymerase sigma factor (sigma-70 family)
VTDPQAEFTSFYRAQFSPVVRTVFLIVNDRGRAEELAQDAFLQLLSHWARVSKYERPDAWVRRVAIRMACRAVRRAQLGRRLLTIHAGRSEPSAPALGSGDEIFHLVGGLPPSQRAAVVLFYYEDRPVADIAELLGCTPTTARVHLHKARQRLATLLHEEVEDVV